jgi:hypothetical protein
MAQTKSKLSEVLNEVPFDEGVLIGESTCKIPAALKSVAIEGTSGNLIEGASGLDRAFLLVENSTAATKHIIVSAGENPPSLRKGLGTLDVTMTEKTLTMIPLDSSRHLDKSGNLVFTFTASTTGAVALVVLKKGV